MRKVAALALAFSLVGCAAVTADDGAGSSADLSAGGLKMNQLQVKGTHNSYHRARWFFPSASLNYNFEPLDTQLGDQGVRAFELDLHFDADKKSFEVFHVKWDEGSTCKQLSDCLKTLKTWSDAHREHAPIFIQLETKDDFDAKSADAYFAALDAQILGVWPKERIITPDLVKGGAANVRTAVTTTGWPTLDSARGKIVFYIEPDDAARATYYTHGDKDLAGRLAFISSDTNKPYAAISIMDDPVARQADIQKAVKAGFIIRTRADADLVEPKKNDHTRETAAFSSGAQIVSTDFPAKDPNYAYVVTVPNGTPSRCNPVNGASGCVSAEVENLGLGK